MRFIQVSHEVLAPPDIIKAYRTSGNSNMIINLFSMLFCFALSVASRNQVSFLSQNGGHSSGSTLFLARIPETGVLDFIVMVFELLR